MAGSQETFNKKDKEKKRLKKRLDKQQKLAERKANSQGGGLENMMAYVDEYGQITDTPQNPANRKKIDAGSIEIGVPKREAVEVPTVRNGRVEYFNHSKGFGFIKELETQRNQHVAEGRSYYEVVACIDGRGFRERREDMRQLLLRLKGKVFTMATLDYLVPHTGIRHFAALPNENP